jgi:hypothetical protein
LLAFCFFFCLFLVLLFLSLKSISAHSIQLLHPRR